MGDSEWIMDKMRLVEGKNGLLFKYPRQFMVIKMPTLRVTKA